MKKNPLILTLIIFSSGIVFADYPVIQQTNLFSDNNFIQQQNDVEIFYRTRDSFEDQPDLILFRFNLEKEYSIYALSAAFNLPYDTLASLNNLSHPHEIKNREYILVPNQPGLFVCQTPIYSELQDILKSKDRSNLYNKSVLVNQEAQNYQYVFYPGENFAPDERDFFLKSLFSFPIDSRRVSSRYGYRIDPFSGNWSLHSGVDLKTDTGTPVYPARSGEVIEISESPIYGHYIILQHDLGFTTMYAHLSEIEASEGQMVNKQYAIAKSGNSGFSTGPHLHFEIRKDGNPVDPALYLSQGFQ